MKSGVRQDADSCGRRWVWACAMHQKHILNKPRYSQSGWTQRLASKLCNETEKATAHSNAKEHRQVHGYLSRMQPKSLNIPTLKACPLPFVCHARTPTRARVHIRTPALVACKLACTSSCNMRMRWANNNPKCAYFPVHRREVWPLRMLTLSALSFGISDLGIVESCVLNL